MSAPGETAVAEEAIDSKSAVRKGVKERPHDVEPHTVSAALFLVLAVGCDCATALEPLRNTADVAVSLRISSLVSVLLLSSPPLLLGQLVRQRVFLALVVVVLALSGEHRGGIDARTGDCVYTMFALLMAVLIIHAGGVESPSVRPDDVSKSAHRRQTISALCGALFLYVGVRGTRSAFVAARETRSYSAHHSLGGGDEVVTSAGLAYSSAAITAPLAFGHGMLACLGFLVVLHEEMHDSGSSVVAFEVGACGVGVAVAATWALLAYSEQLDALHYLYGEHSCTGARDVCREAYRARRFALANASTTGLWASTLACLAFSFAVERRNFDDRVTRAEHLWSRQTFGLGVVFLLSSTVALVVHSSTLGAQWHTDVCAILCVFGIFVSFASDTLAGTIIFVVSSSYEEIRLLTEFGADRVLCHLTHCTLFLNLALLVAHALLSLVKTLILRNFDLYARSPLNVALACVATFGTSLAAALYVASLILLASSDGTLPEDKDTIRDGSGSRTMISFVVSHFVPVFAWVPLYGCRCEVQLLGSRERTIVWLLSVPSMVAVYVVVLSLLETNAPSAKIVDEETFVLIGVPGLAAWASSALL